MVRIRRAIQGQSISGAEGCKVTWRVLMLAWEYPPNHVGGLGRHVRHISSSLLERGAKVTVLTRSAAGGTRVWDDEGVKVLSVAPYELHPPDFITWATQLNVSLLESAYRLLQAEDFDVIHAHDWVVAYAARALKHSWNLPLVATIHATEFGRQRGLHNPSQAHISETEWWLCYEACRVITCSRHMRREVQGLFRVPRDKVRVIPNGIDGSWFAVQRKTASHPLVIFVGRLVPEKGAHVLVDAMHDVVREFPDAELVIAGAGPMEHDIRTRAYHGQLGDRVKLVGHLDDRGLRDLYSRAWIACFPSAYEPFGIVALEAMATGVPCIAGNAGGLREIISHGVTGLTVEPDNPRALADSVLYLLRNPKVAEEMALRAKAVSSENYSWKDIAGKTVAVYDEVLGAGASWDRAPDTNNEPTRMESEDDQAAVAARLDSSS